MRLCECANYVGKQIQTSLRLISVSLSNVLYCIYDVSVVSRCTLYLNKILFTLNDVGMQQNQVFLHGGPYDPHFLSYIGVCCIVTRT